MLYPEPAAYKPLGRDCANIGVFMNKRSNMQPIDQRVVALEQAVNSVSAVTINALLAIITSVSKLDSFDKDALKTELENLKLVQIPNGNQTQYSEILTLLQSRIS
ncbi:hypothetical protein V2K91_06100 [Pseudomonas alliivorans]|nr:hypothetical protein [Pseudomonas alliivorans]